MQIWLTTVVKQIPNVVDNSRKPTHKVKNGRQQSRKPIKTVKGCKPLYTNPKKS